MKGFTKKLLLILLVLSLTATTVLATTLDDLEDEQEDINAQIKAGQQEVKQMEAQLAELNESIAALNTKILDTEAIINDYSNQIEKKQLQIEQARIDLAAAIEEEAIYKEEVTKRIQVMYEYGDTGYIEVLFEADNLNDFFTRLEYLNQIMRYDDEMLIKLNTMQSEIAAKKASLENEETILQHLKAEADLKKAELERAVDEKTILTLQIENDREMMLAQLAWLEEEEKRVQQEIEAELERMRKMNLKFVDGDFAWPVPEFKGYISSYFGSRISPITGKPEFHNGLDIPAPYGVDVLAAASGIVIRSNYSSSYGNVIIINHGDGFVSLYAHNSQLLVQVGDQVTQGQVIAKIGSTGWSTGNHLHFSIQKDGEWIDPLQFYNIK